MVSVIALSGQVTCTCAGKAVQFTSTSPGTYIIRPMGGNDGTYIYVGNDGSTTGDVTSSNGYQLKKGLDSLLITVTNLNQLWLDATTNSEGACWSKVMAENIATATPSG